MKPDEPTTRRPTLRDDQITTTARIPRRPLLASVGIAMIGALASACQGSVAVASPAGSSGGTTDDDPTDSANHGRSTRAPEGATSGVTDRDDGDAPGQGRGRQGR